MSRIKQIYHFHKTVEMLPQTRRMHLVAGVFTVSIFLGITLGAIGKAIKVVQLKHQEFNLRQEQQERVRSLVSSLELENK